VKPTLHLLLVAALAILCLVVARAADAPAGEDPIASLLRERYALTGEEVVALPEVFTTQLKVTVDLTGKTHDQALALVEGAEHSSGIQISQLPDGTRQASLRQDGPPHQPAGAVATNAGAPIARITLRAAPLEVVLAQMLAWTGKTLVIPYEVLSDRRGGTISLSIQHPDVTVGQATGFLREIIQEQIGVVFDDLTDGGWQARKLDHPIDRHDAKQLTAQTAAAAAGDGKVTKLYLNDAPIDLIIGQLGQWSGKTIYASPEVSAVKFKNRVALTNVTAAEATGLLVEFLEKQAGIVFDELPDGLWLVHLLARDRDPKAEGVVFRGFESRSGLNLLAELSDDRKIDVSPGVLKCPAHFDLSIYAATHSQVVAKLREALDQQAGIVGTDLPDGTLQLRLKSGETDPLVPALDFNATPIDDVLARLTDLTGRKITKSYSSPRAGRQPPDFAGRTITLHLENTASSQVAALLFDALEKQAEVQFTVSAEGATDRFGLTARLTPAAIEKLPRTQDFNAESVATVLMYLRAWTSRKIDAPAEVRQSGGTVTLAIQNLPTNQAVPLLRDALQQQTGVVLNEQPDGNFTARLLPRTESFAAPAAASKP